MLYNKTSFSTAEAVGDLVDKFVTDRFEWGVITEPYTFKGNRQLPLVVFERVKSKKLLAIAKFIRKRQFPTNCSSRKVLAAQDGMRFWGSMSDQWSVLMAWMVTKKDLPIIAPYFVGWEMAGDSEYCGHIKDHQNKWLCYFLPMTNCSIPLRSKSQEFQHAHEKLYVTRAADPPPPSSVLSLEGMMDTSDDRNDSSNADADADADANEHHGKLRGKIAARDDEPKTFVFEYKVSEL
jgi:hypothetical protein